MVAVLRTFDVAHVWYGGGSLQQYPGIHASLSNTSASFSNTSASSSWTMTLSTFASHVAALAWMGLRHLPEQPDRLGK